MKSKNYTENEKKALDMNYELAKMLLGYRPEDKPESGKLIGELRDLYKKSEKI